MSNRIGLLQIKEITDEHELDIEELFRLYNALKGAANTGAAIVFSGANQLAGSDSTGTLVTGRLIKDDYIDNQTISTTKIVGLDDILKLLKDRLDGIDTPVTIQTTVYNDDTDEFDLVDTLTDLGSAAVYTLFLEPLVKKFQTKALNFLKGLANIKGARSYAQLVDSVDDIVSDVAQNVTDIATQTANTTALQTRVTAVETQTTALNTRTAAVETQTTALQTRTTAIETVNATQTTSIATNTAGLAANDAHDLVQDGLISTATSVATGAATTAGSALALAGTASGVATGAASLGASNSAAIGALTLALIAAGIFSSSGEGDSITYVNNPSFDPTSLNNSVASLNTSVGSLKTLADALVNNGFATLSGTTYTLTSQFIALLSGGGSGGSGTGNSVQFTQLMQDLVANGFYTQSSADGVVTYTPTSSFNNIIANVAKNSTDSTLALNTFVSSGFLTSSTTNGVTTYTPAQSLPNIYQRILNVSNNMNPVGTALSYLGLLTKNFGTGDLSNAINKTITYPSLVSTMMALALYTTTTDASNNVTYNVVPNIPNLLTMRSNVDSLRNALQNIGILDTNIYTQDPLATALYQETKWSYVKILRNLLDYFTSIGVLTKNTDLTYTVTPSLPNVITSINQLSQNVNMIFQDLLQAGLIGYNGSTLSYVIPDNLRNVSINQQTIGDSLVSAGLLTRAGSIKYDYTAVANIPNLITEINTLKNASGVARSIMQGNVSSQYILVSGEYVKFNSVGFSQGTNITLDTTSNYSTATNVPSIGRITLKANKLYFLKANLNNIELKYNDAAQNTSAFILAQWYNVDTGTQIGNTALNISSTFANTWTSGSDLSAYFKPTVDTRIAVRLVLNGGSSLGAISVSSGGNGPTSFIIEEVGAYGYTVSTTLPNGNIFVGDSSGQAQAVALSGDLAISNSGVAKLTYNYNADAGILPPFEPNLYAHWISKSIYWSTGGNGIVQGNSISRWVPVVKKGLVGPLINTNTTANTYPYMSNDGTNAIDKAGAFSPAFVNGGFIANGLNFADVNGPLSQYTICAMVKPYFTTPTASGAQSQYIFGSDSGNTGSNSGLFIDSTGIILYSGNGALYVVASPNVNIGTNNLIKFQANTYYLVTVVVSVNHNFTNYYNWSGNTASSAGTQNLNSGYMLTVYINGQPCGTTCVKGPAFNVSSFAVGCRANTTNVYTNNPFNGTIDSLSIYDHPFTQAQVTTYKQYVLSKYPNQTLPNVY